ncbi:MAG: phenylalanine--tRNA ligase subunit beta [Endomicrobium sp.]|jgi:phenylalanyl-tRNA synthetase beta chain|nr:phenylalanine--tRNA ligase subunit beta [Endomicrobium sp.]
MEISYKWLKKFMNFDLSPKDIELTLNSVGIETVVIPSNVIAVKILDVQKHSYADRLYLCKVSDGSNSYSVICGAKNIVVGQVVLFAKTGAVLRGNLKIKELEIKNIKSEGMLCSKADLGLEEKSEGILILDKNTKIGTTLENIFDNFDLIFNVEITTNRGDCLSYLGIAREIGAKLQKIVSIPSIKLFNTSGHNKIEVMSNLCSRYVGSIISGVSVGSSPKWISEILEKSKIKPINNVVDIANYVMVELGQPLHVFDVTKLLGEKIVVRKANDCEKIKALNGIEYKLDSDMLVVTDGIKPISIAGIMGGKYSCVDEKTKIIFLESAIFDATSIRMTSKRLNLSSDSSYRFERGLDWDMSDYASWRAINLIIDIAGGNLESRSDLIISKRTQISIQLRTEMVFRILGYNIEKEEMLSILKFLGIDVMYDSEKILCNIPLWRNDIKEEIDLIEEIARIKGYDFIPSHKTFYYKQEGMRKDNSFSRFIVKEFRNKLNSFGFSEALNYSFSEKNELSKFGLNYSYKIINPTSKENEVLRPSLLPALYKNLLLNIEHDCKTITLFEYGKIFNELGERKTFALIMYGNVWEEWWKWSEQNVNPKYDFYFGSGIIRSILPSNEFTIDKNLNPQNYYHSGKSAAILYKEKSVGQFGILTPLITRITSSVKYEVFYCEIDLELFNDIMHTAIPTYKAYSKFPAVKRDIAVIADKSLQFSMIENVIKGFIKSSNILKEYSLFSVYSNNDKLGEGKIGYSFRLSYQDNEKTLTDKEVNEDVNAFLKKLDNDLGIKLR